MAGKKIYIGEMIEQLQTDISNVVTTLQAHTTALGNINTAVGQSISKGTIKAGTGKVLTTTHAQASVGATGTATVPVKIKVFADGVIRIGGKIASINGVTFQYSLDGGTTKKTIGSYTGGAYILKTIDINIVALQEITFYITAGGYENAYCEANSVFASYDMVNLVVDGFAMQS